MAYTAQKKIKFAPTYCSNHQQVGLADPGGIEWHFVTGKFAGGKEEEEEEEEEEKGSGTVDKINLVEKKAFIFPRYCDEM